MQVFTVPATASMPSAIHGGNGVSSTYSAGTMIQSQPINLAITNGMTSRGSGSDSSYAKVDGSRPDSVPVPSIPTRSINQNHSEQQAQDLSMHAPQPQQPLLLPHQIKAEPQQPLLLPHQIKAEPGAKKNDRLLEFCNIILAYTNYPEAFQDYKPIVQTLGSKGKVKPRSKVDLGSGLARPPQKRKIQAISATVKQKPGRKPKAAKLCPPAAAGAGSGGPPVLRAENVSVPNQEIRQDENATKGKLDQSRVNGNGRRRERKVSSPLNSVGESREGTHSSSSSTSSHLEDGGSQGCNLFYPDDDRDESWEEVTCFCGKPFAGRPMIECENCFVWHHMSCAKLRKTNVPKKFYCRDCKHMFPDFGQERQRRASGNNTQERQRRTSGNTTQERQRKNSGTTTKERQRKNSGDNTQDRQRRNSGNIMQERQRKNSGNGTQERQRKNSGNNNVLGVESVSQYGKNPVKTSKNGLPKAGAEFTMPLALTIPPLHAPLSKGQYNSPKVSPSFSPSLSPQEGNNYSQLPSGGKAGPSSAIGAMSPTSAQQKFRQQPYLNGTTNEMKPVQTLSKSSSTLPERNHKQSPEKPAKRRPTLNSASSGLYDDVVLALKMN